MTLLVWGEDANHMVGPVPDIARHVIQHTANPRHFSQMGSCDVASNINISRHVIQHNANPRFLNQMGSGDVASNIVRP